MKTTIQHRTTCGLLYRKQLELYTGYDARKIRLFAAGFVTGQAEKVYLGACATAMFRPSADHFVMLLSVVKQTAKNYGLAVVVTSTEIWLCRKEQEWKVKAMQRLDPQSEEAHFMRGSLCGVPQTEIDGKFHERKGYGERCD